MFGLIKKAFILLLRFSRSTANVCKFPDCTKCISVNNQPCIT